MQLNLALAWNRSDLARKEIFNIENRAAWQVKIVFLCQICIVQISLWPVIVN